MLTRMELRELKRSDWPQLLALNLASVENLSALDEQRLGWLLSFTQIGLSVESDGAVIAFALAIAPGAPYDSENYRAFEGMFERFIYLDRVVVSATLRRQGVATMLYEAIEAQAHAGGFDRVVCEVNLSPPNEASLAFHAARGYLQIGQLASRPGKLVALLSKSLREPPG